MAVQEIGSPGFRYKTDFERPAQAVIEEYKKLMNQTGCLTGQVGDCLGRGAGANSRIKGLGHGMAMVGPALTVKVPPEDNLMVHKALHMIKPGDVMVIDAGGDHSWALIGILMTAIAAKHGAEGIIIDGCVRDAAEIRELGFPVFAAGISPNGPFKEGPGEINYPITCGGQVVHPGDLIVADDDGVVVVQREFAGQENIGQVKAVIERETKRMAEIQAGQTIKPGLEETFRKKGLEWV